MKIQRREFLATAVAGTAGALLGGNARPAVANEPASPSLNPTATVPLGKALTAGRISCVEYYPTNMEIGWEVVFHVLRMRLRIIPLGRVYSVSSAVAA